MTLKTSLFVQLSAFLTEPAVGGLGIPLHDAKMSEVLTMADGVAADQADIVYSASFTIAGSGTQVIDLNAVTDTLGNAITFADVKMMAFFAYAANGDRIDIGGNSSDPFDDWIGNVTTAEIQLYPGDIFVLTRKGAGWPIVNNSSDKLLLTNISGSSVTIDVLIIGTDT